jgi:D-alanyl-D-alanine carboxypeptidase/D-alanyl-D-alanine-endopeptidase (penicillin-binding protein 4)
MYESEYKDIWLDSFPIGGIDGTLKNRFKNGSAANNVKAKTGTISNVRGLSGYVKTKEGENIVFSFLINGHLLTSKDTELVTDKVIELIADYTYQD